MIIFQTFVHFYRKKMVTLEAHSQVHNIETFQQVKNMIDELPFSVFGMDSLELGWENDYTRLKVLYIVFRELSHGISGFGF